MKKIEKSIYRFGNAATAHVARQEGLEPAGTEASMRLKLGGKGAGLMEMTRLGIPVPPGFTIATGVCNAYLEQGALPHGFAAELAEAMAWLEEAAGRRFGDPHDPLLISVRSGAAVSMPGMMDTILNVGLTREALPGLATQSGSRRFALDSYRRLLQMFGSVVLAAPKKEFDAVMESARERERAGSDAQLSERALEEILAGFDGVIEQSTGAPFPSSVGQQLSMAIEAVFQSWRNDRAQYYRRLHGIPEELGTAVTVQAMVFGNADQRSGTGVGFSRNPSTGENVLFGEFLVNAQGEDIVAGTRTPVAIAALAESLPEVYEQLTGIVADLEAHYRDAQDFEFTVERGRLFLLQTRAAKRSALAAVRIAVEMADEGLISRAEAVARVNPASIAEILAPQLDFSGGVPEVLARGIAASPGAAVGRIALTSDAALAASATPGADPVILVTQETTADDIHGMAASVGFLTACGGATSHAAVVARGMGKCCITAARGIRVDAEAGVVRIGEAVFQSGDWISLDASTGRVFAGRVPLRAADADNRWLNTLRGWALDQLQQAKVAVRANADTPQDAANSRAAGAQGIGLCRTEHMFFLPERLPHVRSMILASTEEARTEALRQLLPMQQQDFESLFRAMGPFPVTIRLLDPPLHEFLPPSGEVEAELQRARGAQNAAAIEAWESLAQRLASLSETNPMMGHRGCRLSITYPEILRMQVRAILQAALVVAAEGFTPVAEIMVPLVACAEEMRWLRERIDAVASEVFAGGRSIDYRVGTMIELPRAALCAGAIAEHVSFVSFGTNDLTQMTFGFSRDDASKYLEGYLQKGILSADPFLTIDREGVGSLIEIAIRQLRARKPELKIGVCGEHGGDPASIAYFASLGVDYVSCSPARLPTAQLAMAQAFALAEGDSQSQADSASLHAA